jgi:phospholipid/cholesterol/gamma-HCH transport system permease protein
LASRLWRDWALGSNPYDPPQADLRFEPRVRLDIEPKSVFLDSFYYFYHQDDYCHYSNTLVSFPGHDFFHKKGQHPMAADKQSSLVKEKIDASGEISFDHPAPGNLLARLSGSWKTGARLPAGNEVSAQIERSKGIVRIGFETDRITAWDSSLLTFLMDIHDYCSAHNIVLERDGLPDGVGKLIALATAVPERKGARKKTVHTPILDRIGTSALALWQAASELLVFIGEAVVVFARFLVGKASFRFSDLTLLIQECGVDALPIVLLISFLVGLILAFVGAVQLEMFGAQIFVANLVGIAMVRVLGAVMAGIVMAGRTGAAFAAQLGTMQVNEEIDALKTMGVSPMEFLVLPRMLALVLMMPLLCVFADLMGILGGLVVGVGLLDIGLIQYLNQTKAALNLNHFFIGIFQAGVFGVLVALAGCLRGMECGRSASAVGDATTSAVVTSIVAITVATAIVTLVCNVLHI